jgi:hypothetical protein
MHDSPAADALISMATTQYRQSDDRSSLTAYYLRIVSCWSAFRTEIGIPPGILRVA